MGSIKKVYEALINRKGKVCHKSEIIKIIEEYKKKFKSHLNTGNTLKYLVRHNYLKRIFKKYYYINSYDERGGYLKYEDKEIVFIVLNKLNIKWYVGLSSALYSSRKIWQVPTTLHIINNKLSGIKRILGLKIRFLKIKENLIFGIKKSHTTNNIPYYCSLPSKTYIDMVYFRMNDKLVKDKDTKKYLRYYPKWVGNK